MWVTVMVAKNYGITILVIKNCGSHYISVLVAKNSGGPCIDEIFLQLIQAIL